MTSAPRPFQLKERARRFVKIADMQGNPAKI